MVIDKQRIAAVKTLQALGYTFSLADAWPLPSASTAGGSFPIREADAMHSLLVERADEIDGCPDGSSEDSELKTISDVLEAYEAKRWPNGKEPGGKG